MNTLEKTILTALLRDMRAAGYQPCAVWTGEDYVMADARGGTSEARNGSTRLDRAVRPLTDEEVFAVFADYDMATPTLHFTHLNRDTWGNRGVMIVEGNGEDIISDFHCADGEPFSPIIQAIYDKLSEGAAL
jgi:hypothetical protein